MARRPFNGAVIITTEYGEKEDGARRGYHTGVDYALNEGTPIYSPTDGKVSYVGDGRSDSDGRGFYIGIRGDDGKGHCLYHLRDYPQLEAGQRVTEGQQIAYSGNTGKSSGPHLHWELREDVNNNQTDFAPGNWLFAGQPSGTPVTSSPGTNSAPVTILMARLFGDFRTLWRDINSAGTVASGRINQVAPNQWPAKYLDYAILERRGNFIKIGTAMYGEGWVLVNGQGTESLTQFYNA